MKYQVGQKANDEEQKMQVFYNTKVGKVVVKDIDLFTGEPLEVVGTAKCHSDDTFNLEKGIMLALLKGVYGKKAYQLIKNMAEMAIDSTPKKVGERYGANSFQRSMLCNVPTIPTVDLSQQDLDRITKHTLSELRTRHAQNEIKLKAIILDNLDLPIKVFTDTTSYQGDDLTFITHVEIDTLYRDPSDGELYELSELRGHYKDCGFDKDLGFDYFIEQYEEQLAICVCTVALGE